MKHSPHDLLRLCCTMALGAAFGIFITTIPVGSQRAQLNFWDTWDAIWSNTEMGYCTDGIVQPELGEECDDGNMDNFDGCTTNCKINTANDPGLMMPGTGYCGDGIVQAELGEECDDGNTDDWDNCTVMCTTNSGPECGNNIVEPGEECDGEPGCTACVWEPAVAEPGEWDDMPAEPGEWDDMPAEPGEWDDMPMEPGDTGDYGDWGGPPTPPEGECGDGEVNGYEACDDGNTDNLDGCDEFCQWEPEGLEAYCGNGKREGEEECDDGNYEEQDGCNMNCQYEYCGDGVEQSGIGEECDDGNMEPWDGCSEQCKIEENMCGDKIIQEDEGCDDGNTESGDGCNSECRPEFCGDGVLQPKFEECEDENMDSGDGCSWDCKKEYCGDGTTQPDLGEQCDDKNNDNDDGCTNDCKKQFCGDGIVQPKLGEQCDDKNVVNTDGCTNDCKKMISVYVVPSNAVDGNSERMSDLYGSYVEGSNGEKCTFKRGEHTECHWMFQYQSNVSLKAVPSDTAVFKFWDPGTDSALDAHCPCASDRYEENCSFVAEKNRACKALFGLKNYWELAVMATPGSEITVKTGDDTKTCKEVYPASCKFLVKKGDSVTLSATRGTYNFFEDKWSSVFSKPCGCAGKSPLSECSFTPTNDAGCIMK